MSVHLFDGIFRDGSLAMRWGEIERCTFADNDRSLSAATFGRPDDYHSGLQSIIAKLMAHSELRLRAARWPDSTVTDRISLSGSGRAISALRCG